MDKQLYSNLIVIAFFAIINFTSIKLNAQLFTEDTTFQVGAGSCATNWADYDNDGDLDIIVAGVDEYNSSTGKEVYGTHLYRNDAGIFTEVSGLPFPNVYKSAIAWGDYDNDGDVDLLIAGATKVYADYQPLAKLFRNNGSENFEEIASFTGVHSGDVEFADYDGDGDLDIFLTGDADNRNASTQLHRNNGNNTFTSISSGLANLYNSSIDLGDVDGDGDLDAILMGQEYSPYTTIQVTSLYINNNGVYQLSGESIAQYCWGDVEFGDHDSDGDLDFLITGFADGSSDVRVYLNNGLGSFTGKTIDSIPDAEWSKVDWGDYDNDGDPDILICGEFKIGYNVYYLTRVYDNIGSDKYQLVHTAQTEAKESDAKWGDYDNDGDLDIVYGGSDGYHSYIAKVLSNNASTANSNPGIPINLMAKITGDSVILSWTKATDAETPQNGLHYNLYMGTSSKGNEVLAGHYDFTNSKRLVSCQNYTTQDTFKIITGISPATKYYWSIQTVDNGWLTSAFATEQLLEPGEKITISGVLANKDLCIGDTLKVGVEHTGSNPFQYQWQRNGTNIVEARDSLLAINDLQTDDNGLYRLIISNSEGADTSSQFALTVDGPTISISDTAICNGNSCTIDAGAGYASYKWSDGSTNQTLEVSTVNDYSITVTDANGCMASDEMTLTVNNNPTVNLGDDKEICEGDSIILDAGGFTSYMWHDNSANQTFKSEIDGSHSVTVTDSKGCVASDEVILTVNNNPTVNLGDDKEICEGDSIILDAGAFTSYMWHDNSANQTFKSEIDGSHSVTVTDSNGCVASDEVILTVNNNPTVNLGDDKEICEGDSIILDAGAFTSYMWHDNSTNQTFKSEIDGSHSVTVTDSNGCVASDEMTLRVNNNPVVDLSKDTTIRKSETIILSAASNMALYKWNGDPGLKDETLQLSGNSLEIGINILFVDVTDYNGCSATDTVSITVTNSTRITQYSYDKTTATQVYPNPVSGQAIISPSPKNEVVIYDMFGKIIKHVHITDNVLEMTDLPGGVYFVKVNDELIKVIKE